MKVGIDISQIAHEKTGVSDYLRNLIQTLIKLDRKNEYILFFSSLRKEVPKFSLGSNAKIKKFRLPPTILDFLWNKLHILPIEQLIGKVDVFITSDWTEPPAKAKKATIIYDLSIYKTPQETAKKIVDVQKRKLQWVKRESDVVFCISKSTRKDVMDILGIPEDKLRVIYPGA